MAVADPDLDRFRHDLAALIGVPVSEVGMLPDEDHLQGGGYHCGRADLRKIGKFHLPVLAYVGSSGEDYSVRQLRDRNAVDDHSAAVDVPDGWGHGGNAAWIRANNMVLSLMQAGDPELAALRAMNFTPDGKVKRRYDTNSRGAGVIASTDTVLWHTHWEFWRDTLGTAVLRRTLARLLVIVKAAIEGWLLPSEEGDDDDMGATFIAGRINPPGQITNINVGIVQGGTADPREAWLSFTNDGPGDYALRVVWTSGDNNYKALEFAGGTDDPKTKPVNNGYAGTVFHKGWRGWVTLPAGCVAISVTRAAIGPDGKATGPSEKFPAADWEIGYAIERGPVKR